MSHQQIFDPEEHGLSDAILENMRSLKLISENRLNIIANTSGILLEAVGSTNFDVQKSTGIVLFTWGHEERTIDVIQFVKAYNQIERFPDGRAILASILSMDVKRLREIEGTNASATPTIRNLWVELGKFYKDDKDFGYIFDKQMDPANRIRIRKKYGVSTLEEFYNKAEAGEFDIDKSFVKDSGGKLRVVEPDKGNIMAGSHNASPNKTSKVINKLNNEEVYDGEMYSDISRINRSAWSKWLRFWDKSITWGREKREQSTTYNPFLPSWNMVFILGYQTNKKETFEIWYHSIDSSFSVMDYRGNEIGARSITVNEATKQLFRTLSKIQPDDAKWFTSPTDRALVTSFQTSLRDDDRRMAEFSKRQAIEVDKNVEAEKVRIERRPIDTLAGQALPKARSSRYSAGDTSLLFKAEYDVYIKKLETLMMDTEPYLTKSMKETAKGQMLQWMDARVASTHSLDSLDTEKQVNIIGRQITAAFANRLNSLVDATIDVENITSPTKERKMKSRLLAKLRQETRKLGVVPNLIEVKRLYTAVKEDESRVDALEYLARTSPSSMWKDHPKVVEAVRAKTVDSEALNNAFRIFAQWVSAEKRKDGLRRETIEHSIDQKIIALVIEAVTMTAQFRRDRERETEDETVTESVRNDEPTIYDEEGKIDQPQLTDHIREVESIRREKVPIAPKTLGAIADNITSRLIDYYDATRFTKSDMNMFKFVLNFGRGRHQRVVTPRSELGIFKSIMSTIKGQRFIADFVQGVSIDNRINYEIWYITEPNPQYDPRTDPRKTIASYYVFDATAKTLIRKFLPYKRNAIHILTQKLAIFKE